MTQILSWPIIHQLIHFNDRKESVRVHQLQLSVQNCEHDTKNFYDGIERCQEGLTHHIGN